MTSKLIAFIKDHGFEAKELGNGKIEMLSPYTQNGEMGIAKIVFSPTLKATRDALGY